MLFEAEGIGNEHGQHVESCLLLPLLDNLHFWGPLPTRRMDQHTDLLSEERLDGGVLANSTELFLCIFLALLP